MPSRIIGQCENWVLVGLGTIDGHLIENPGLFALDTIFSSTYCFHSNADKCSRAHYYNISMGKFSYPYSCKSSAYDPSNPFPVAGRRILRLVIRSVSVGALLDNTSQCGPNKFFIK